ncbi:PD40 domain-containing protein [Methylacidiphilum caldifontis]|uniref:PD40 domain-containing protein n=1 Tax=Methylacidiphilum caldifontis TaxID=2795386 RepID=UPI001A8EF46D|nr:PD40 domain-containing protein [Methylacidiphilum caldifontis]QSR88018.1 PD40 domain-containing protein [Methylacidiphilum caldifontis]
MIAVLFFVSCLLFLPSICLYGQVEVTGGKVRVFLGHFQGKDAESCRKIISKDLLQTLLIDVSSEESERYEINAHLTDKVLEGSLLDKVKKTELIHKSFSGGDLRQSSHLFSDAILETLTGIKGFSSCKIAFISSETGFKELYIMDMDGAGLARLTADKTISAHPRWSHDRSMIAYTSYKSGYPDVYIIKLAKHSRIRFSFFPGVNSGACFSPDDKSLALTLSKDGNPEIYIMDLEGGTPRQLTQNRATNTSPCWSPDGKQIVYTSDERGSIQLFVIPAEGGHPKRLITGNTYSSEPDWSADGQKIAFSARIGGQFQVGVYNLSTNQASILTTQGGEDPSWTPNSRHLVYASEGSLYLMDTVSRQTTKLNCELKNCSQPSVSP